MSLRVLLLGDQVSAVACKTFYLDPPFLHSLSRKGAVSWRKRMQKHRPHIMQITSTTRRNLYSPVRSRRITRGVVTVTMEKNMDVRPFFAVAFIGLIGNRRVPGVSCYGTEVAMTGTDCASSCAACLLGPVGTPVEVQSVSPSTGVRNLRLPRNATG